MAWEVAALSERRGLDTSAAVPFECRPRLLLRGRLRREREAVKAAVLHGGDELRHLLILHVGVGLELHRDLGLLLQTRREHVRQLVLCYALAVQFDLSAAVQRECGDDRLMRDGRGDARQVHAQRLREEGRDDDEDDQQDLHHGDERRDVDLGEGLIELVALSVAHRHDQSPLAWPRTTLRDECSPWRRGWWDNIASTSALPLLSTRCVTVRSLRTKKL